MTFSNHGLPGDFWIVAARPDTPDLVVPWDLLKEAPPAGTQFFFAPLAVILWFVDVEFPTTVKSQVLDCRHKFRPLCEVGEGLKVSTGLVIFQDVGPGDSRPSPLIPHGLGVNYVAIVMAVELPSSFEPIFLPGVVHMGDLDVAPLFNTIPPLMLASYDPNDPNKVFKITLQDRRPAGSLPATWQVRWWAIPKTLDQPNVTVSPPSEANIVVTPTALNFGNITVGQTADQNLTVGNTGNAELNVDSIGSDNARFSTVPPAVSFTVAAGGEQPVTVRFAPTFAGAQAGTLSINSNDPDEPTVPVQLQGIGSVPVPDIGVFPTNLDFGTVQLGQEPSRSLFVRNGGNAPLSVAPITGGFPPFSVSPTGAFTVAAGGEQIVNVRFRPTTIGPATDTLTINSNDPDEPVRSVELRGRGTLGPPPPQ